MSEAKKRGKYGRPCDACAARRVRCVPNPDGDSCMGCLSHGVPCTRNRVRKKSGPKGFKSRPIQPDFLHTITPPASFHQLGKTSPKYEFLPLPEIPAVPELGRAEPQDVLSVFEHSEAPTDQYTARFSLDSLLPTLQVYQTWFYGYWPVLSVADLMLTVYDGAQMLPERNFVRLTEKNAHLYALCCAVCAAIIMQVSFVSSTVNVACGPVTLGHAYAEEAKRVRNLFDYTSNPLVETVLSLFFLYAHFVNNKGRTPQAIVYLREAITVAQLLGFHEPASYVGKTAAEVHRWKKIYYTLLVTERFMCFEDAMPVVLDPCINFPELDNEEYPSLLVGFTELIRVFSIPNKKFFGEMNQKGHSLPAGELSLSEKRQWIYAVQKKLGKLSVFSEKVSEVQKLNILLSRSWIRAIAWHITSENGLLRHLDDGNDCFDVSFPVTNAREFLAAAADLPLFAFEANGPGICVKLLEMANSLTCAFSHSSNRGSVIDALDNVFRLVNTFRSDVMLPVHVYVKVSRLLSSYKTRYVPRPIENCSAISEVLDEPETGTDASDAPNIALNPAIPESVIDTPPITKDSPEQASLTPYYMADLPTGFTPDESDHAALNYARDFLPSAMSRGSLHLYLQAMGFRGARPASSSSSALANVMASFMFQPAGKRSTIDDLMGDSGVTNYGLQ